MAIILLGVIAIMGICFTPAFADEPEIQDDSFGQRYQTTWVTASEFVGISSEIIYRIDETGYLRVITGSPPQVSIFEAVIHLPSGAYFEGARFYYYDNAIVFTSMDVIRCTVPLQGRAACIDLCSVNSGAAATPGYSSSFGDCTGGIDTIKNVDNTYKINVTLASTTTLSSFYGVRLWWKRQIRTGLSHPFNDIGGLSQNFRDSIAALYQSQITTGTSPTTYSPNNPVTRAQMAAFLARALGLHWDIGDGY